MANPDEKVIAAVLLSDDAISDDGKGRVGFTVTWKASRPSSPNASLAGIEVSADIVPAQGVTFPAGGGPKLSADGVTWESYADKKTDAAGLAVFHVKSGAGAGAFKVSGAIGDAEEPYHKTSSVALAAKGAISAIEFSPNESRTTWQGEFFPQQPAIAVNTRPSSGQTIEVSLAGPGATADPADHNAAFTAGGQKHSVVSGSPLPLIKAGKMMGVVTITAGVGAIHSGSMTWHVKAIPDRLLSPHPGHTEHVGFDERDTHLSSFKFRLTGHRVQGSKDDVQMVGIADWPVRLELTETIYAMFSGAGMQDSGRALITKTDTTGAVVIPSSRLMVKESAANQTIKIKASWNDRHDQAGVWRAGQGNESQLWIYFDT